MMGSRPAYTVETFLAARVDTTSAGGCWTTRGASRRYGYQVVSVKGARFRAHRWVYEQIVGAIPEGLELDHLCRNTACCNPAHLEPVSHQENMRRARISTCRNGHDLTAPGALYERSRHCRQCVLDRVGALVSCITCRRTYARSNLGRHLRQRECTGAES